MSFRSCQSQFREKKGEEGNAGGEEEGVAEGVEFCYASGLEYGVDEIEIHTDAFEPGSKVLLVDDVLATGGTLVAAIELVKQAGGIVTDIAVLSEITFLGGRARIAEQSPDVSIHALISG